MPTLLAAMLAVGALAFLTLGAAPATASLGEGVSFWAIGMENRDSVHPTPPFTHVAVTNAGAATATVTATPCVGGPPTVFTVGPGSSTEPALNVPNLTGTAVTSVGVVHVTADRQVSVAQINSPNPGDFSTDASALMPEHSWGTSYVVITYDQPTMLIPSQVAIVASVATQVTIRPSVTTLAGPSFPSVAAGEVHTFDLAPCTVAHIEADDDLTGTLVTATEPVGVFAGSACMHIGASGACDHLEEQVWPIASWGTEYPLCRSPLRGEEPDLVRILALEPGPTTVSVGGVPLTLTSSSLTYDHADVEVTGDVMISANRRIAVMHFLQGSTADNVGDPSMTQVTSVGGFSGHHVFRSFSGGWSRSFVMVAAPASASVTLDGAAIPAGGFSGVDGYKCARLDVAGSAMHTVASASPIAVVYGAYGDPFSSYLSTGPSAVPPPPPPPTADFTVEVLGISCQTAMHRFIGSSVPSDAVTDWSWAFSDGVTASGPEVVRTFSQTGTVTAVLTATMSDGLVVTSTHDASVTLATACPPGIAPLGSVVAAPGEPVQRCTSGLPGMGGALTYEATSLPAGASFDAESLCILWAPTAAQRGLWPCLRVTVTEMPSGLQATTCLRVMVLLPGESVPDQDGDGLADDADNCAGVPNPDQADHDADGSGDACGPPWVASQDSPARRDAALPARSDGDKDGWPDATDVCPTTPDADQSDMDRDGQGDACDIDADGDDVADRGAAGLLLDNCPSVANASQGDGDGDGIGDACDAGPASRGSERPQVPGAAPVGARGVGEWFAMALPVGVATAAIGVVMGLAGRREVQGGRRRR